jgi:hypothetical protein
MRKQLDCEFAKSAGAEAPLVIAYAVTLVLFATAWSNFAPTTTSILELKPAVRAERTQTNEMRKPATIPSADVPHL